VKTELRRGSRRTRTQGRTRAQDRAEGITDDGGTQTMARNQHESTIGRARDLEIASRLVSHSSHTLLNTRVR
jgi:hypothetical protein